MGELTQDRPKCMLPVAGRPLLHHIIDRLREIGCRKIAVVVGYESGQISAPDCVLVENPDFATNNILHSLICARRHLEGEVVCSYSDIWLEPEILTALFGQEGDIVAAVDMDWKPYYTGRTMHPVSEAENVFLDEGGRVRSMGKHLGREAVPGLTCGEFMGLWRMSSSGTRQFMDVFDALDKTLEPDAAFQKAREWRKAYITDFLQEMIDQGMAVTASQTNRGWAELDTQQDFERLGQIAGRQRLRTLLP